MGEQNQESGLLVASTFIQKAFEEKNKKNTKNYDFLIEQLSNAQDEILLQRWLQALVPCASKISKDYQVLVETVLKVPWFSGSKVLFEYFVDFLQNLLSSNAYFANICLQCLVSKLTYDPESTLEWNMQVFERTLFVMGDVFRIVPRVSSNLLQLLSDNFPRKRDSTEIQEWYIRNLIRILDAYPAQIVDLLPLIFDQLIKIDVEIQMEVGGASSQDDQLMFSLDEENEAPKEKEVVKNLMEKLDIMMDLMLEYFERFFQNADTGSQESLVRLLFDIFEKQIMLTHQSRYVQYLIFFVLSKNPQYPNAFLSLLFQIMVNPSKNPIVRQSAAGYIAGFISRGKYVDIGTSANCLELVLQWIQAYIDYCEKNFTDEVEPHKFSLFYFVAQAIFYVFCFRHMELLRMEGTPDYCSRMNLNRIVTCKFNPLKLCSRSIASEFARITHKHEILYCYVIIQNNKKIVPTGKNTHSLELLKKELEEGFYVFEPVDLELVKKRIDPLYRTWQEADDSQDGLENSMELANGEGANGAIGDDSWNIPEKENEEGHPGLEDLMFSPESVEIENHLIKRFASSPVLSFN